MKNNVKNLIIKTIKKNKILCAGLFITIICVVTLSLIPPQILKIIIDKNLLPKNNTNLLLLAILYIIVIIFIGIFDFLKEGILTIFGQKITQDIRFAMIKKLEKVDAKFFSINSTGAIVSQLTNDVDTINSLFTNGIIGMVIDLFKIIGTILSMLIFSWKLALFTLLILPIIYLVTRLFQKRTLSAQTKNRILVAKLNNHISESFKNHEMIKAYGKEEYIESNFIKNLEDNYQTLENVNFFDSIFPPFIQLMRGVLIALIILLSNANSSLLGITIGMIAASIELISNLFSPVENLGMELQSIQQAISGIKRVNELLAEKEDNTKQLNFKISDVIPNNRKMKIEFNNVSFSYNKETQILDNINLVFEGQQKITFAGRTGVGKTTLIKLIMGLLKPDHGHILLNGIDVYDIPNFEKRKIFGYVSQDIPMIYGTLAEQISLKDENITAEQITSALDLVGLSSYVKNLKHGLNTLITNENFFSQGQKQLLAIARAIVTNPPILLLDEVTANLDSITEEKVISVLRKAGDNHTIFSVSHRLTSIVTADIIVLLEKGRIKNSGSPEELMKKDEWYRNQVIMEHLTWK